ncbi:MAG: SPFH domain-containing protein [Deltaproteobacteria bacterium]|nr:SPFH domain-containing protein [Deltaproteobacteria bacterium]
MIWLGIASGAAAYLLFFVAAKCTFRVQEGELATLTRFGAALRDPEGKVRTFEPGLHFKAPWEKVRRAPVREQTLQLASQLGGTTAIARDGTLVRFDGVLRHAADPSRLEVHLFGCERPDDHLGSYFMCLVRNEIANYGGDDEAGGEVAWTQLRRDSRQLSDRIEAQCAAVGDRYGVVFNGVDLKDILPPDALVEALNAVMNAKTEAEAAYALAEADAARRILAAEQSVEVARRKAAAAETEIEEIATALAGLQRDGVLWAYVERRRAEVLSQAKHLLVGSAA